MNKETFTARYFSLLVVMNKDEALGCGYAPYKKFNNAHKEQLGIIEKIYHMCPVKSGLVIIKYNN